MNKADLTRMGVTNENIQEQVLKKFNQDLNKYRKEAAGAVKYRDAVHAAHLGYTSDDVPTPETPEQAIAQLVQEVRNIFESEAQSVMTVYMVGIGLLQQWLSVNTLSKEARKELELTTANFLAQHRDPSAAAPQPANDGETA